MSRSRFYQGLVKFVLDNVTRRTWVSLVNYGSKVYVVDLSNHKIEKTYFQIKELQLYSYQKFNIKIKTGKQIEHIQKHQLL